MYITEKQIDGVPRAREIMQVCVARVSGLNAIVICARAVSLARAVGANGDALQWWHYGFKFAPGATRVHLTSRNESWYLVIEGEPNAEIENALYTCRTGELTFDARIEQRNDSAPDDC
jgi:hypothetical protein